MKASTDKRLAKIEENVEKELENEKASRVEQLNSWIKKSDEKLLDICNSMENITSEKGETVDNIALKIRKKMADL